MSTTKRRLARTFRAEVIADAPAGAGTRIVQTFAVTKCPRWWEWIVARFVPGHSDRSAALTEDLRRIAAVAAADAVLTGRRN